MGALIVIALLVLAGLGGLWLLAQRDLTLCLLRVRAGEVSVSHGAMMPRIVSDVREVVRRPRVGVATIRVLRGRTYARVETKGDLTAAQAQQIRNIVGSVPLAKLKSGSGTRG